MLGGRLSHGQSRPEVEIGFGDFEHLMASLFAFSATFEICRDVGRANAKIANENGFSDQGENFPDRPI